MGNYELYKPTQSGFNRKGRHNPCNMKGELTFATFAEFPKAFDTYE